MINTCNDLHRASYTKREKSTNYVQLKTGNVHVIEYTTIDTYVIK